MHHNDHPRTQHDGGPRPADDDEIGRAFGVPFWAGHIVWDQHDMPVVAR